MPNLWPKFWTKPVYRRRRHGLTGWLSPFTPKKVGGSFKLWPLSITDSRRVYLFGARIR